MTRRYMYLSEQTETLLGHYRNRWTGKWPNNARDWAVLDRDKNEVLASIDRKLLDNPHARAEYRAFVRELAGDEPGSRCVDPIRVPGDIAAIGNTDADGYEASFNARAAGIPGDDHAG